MQNLKISFEWAINILKIILYQFTLRRRPSANDDITIIWMTAILEYSKHTIKTSNSKITTFITGTSFSEEPGWRIKSTRNWAISAISYVKVELMCQLCNEKFRVSELIFPITVFPRSHLWVKRVWKLRHKTLSIFEHFVLFSIHL